MTKHALFPLAELDPGQMRVAQVDGRDILVVHDLDGSVFAVRDRCAHSGARLSKGKLLEKVVGDDVDQYVLTDELMIRCPWHGYEYAPKDGRCISDPQRVRVRAYAVTVEDGVVCVER